MKSPSSSGGRVASPHQAGGGVAYQHKRPAASRGSVGRKRWASLDEVGSRGRNRDVVAARQSISFLQKGVPGARSTPEVGFIKDLTNYRPVQPAPPPGTAAAATPTCRAPGPVRPRRLSKPNAAVVRSTRPAISASGTWNSRACAPGSGAPVQLAIVSGTPATCTQPAPGWVRSRPASAGAGGTDGTWPELAGSRPAKHNQSSLFCHSRWSREAEDLAAPRCAR